VILTPHMLAGAAIGAKIHNLWAIFILATALHFLFDRLPHWEYLNNGLEELRGKKFIIFLSKSLIDLAVGGIIIWWLFGSSPLWLYIFFGTFVSILPDGLVFLNRVSGQRIKILRQYCLSHKKLHIPKNKNPRVWGVAIESALVILLFYFLLNLN